MTKPLAPGDTIGILGGGQLGRMLAMAAARLGLQTHVFEPGANAPADVTAGKTTTASYGDLAALEAFAADADVVTYEFENVPVEALDRIEAHSIIRPGRNALAVSQDRLTEKTFLNDIGLQTAPFAAVETAGDLAAALAKIGCPSILKTRRLGYDGKGQSRLQSRADAGTALADMNGAPAILEGFVPFQREISVIAARAADGVIACFEPGENVHSAGILRTTRVPAAIDAGTADAARAIAATILDALDYVGVLGVELFVTPDALIVNEIAPRVHNSGHWTEAGCIVDQFEMHIRAVAGLPLFDPIRHSDVEMINLIGDDMDDLPRHLADPAARVHLYGKAETRDGRKMGHVTRVLAPAQQT